MVGKIATHKDKRLTGVRGWFNVAGTVGNYDLEERLIGLRQLEPVSRNATILDLGCAEGLIGMHLMKTGPGRLMHGLDEKERYLVGARMIARRERLRAKFLRVDLNHLAEWRAANPDVLLGSYDVVLCLCIAHKLNHPEQFLRQAAGLCGGYFALQLPASIINDRRSGHHQFDANWAMLGWGFELFHEEYVSPITTTRTDGIPRPLFKHIYRRIT